MQFLVSCAEMADMVEEAISGLSGNSRASAFVAMGADGTPTKYIDKVAEDVIFEYLRENEICANVISEEAGRCEMPSGEGTVIVDPIDGTSNAIRGIPYYALSIAREVDGHLEEAFIRDLAHHETFTAIYGKGAWLDGSSIRVSETRNLEEATVSLYGRRYHPESLMGLGKKIRRWRLMGASALELAYVGAGRIDAFVDLRGSLRITDAAAGILICQESGGMVSAPDSGEIRYSGDVREGARLVASNGHLHPGIMDVLEVYHEN
ncbi:fructose-1,6-bisphosphatase [Methanomicrobiaceae archaeon CYW5]|uniref:bifunctional fructose-bisphosphatase/inositol-phosphate phosphatase n=1 Tax=Methanovulcanius yangii TaxID=1789227 RepID=UPI0029CA621B|nr:bifunctional fructose-bisphosphatase/inositol-phosphate phosphatase [Methanovulcanius yangii]MBT8507315.1 fructose-1,6-bisphosphatase [Methanovulcanius yangii]